ncbi:MAG TPA: homocysteine S-methyltransferase family protein, partial [Vicinamibacterales bacterium]|nr:homocysteine S-methyltransferase family protein [Vicinamibacterales bacterium]
LPPGGCGEAWNLDAPEKVLAIQRAYADAGSDCLITNTFGASRIMLDRHDEGERTQAINRAAVEIARRAFGGRPGYVLGDIGPFGGLMEPYGDIPVALVEKAFGEQAEALVSAGIDAIIIETQTSLEELGVAIAAAQAAGAPCIIGSMAFDRLREGDEVRTMMGTSPEQAAAFMAEAGCHVLGLNCGSGIDMRIAADTARRYRSVSGLPIMAQPNAGLPVLENLKVIYRETPDEMAAGVPALLDAGARIIGGCCGSTPAHIRRFREIVDHVRHQDRARA